jgi:hypothetical protein
MIMKNMVTYYLAILLPILLLNWMAKSVNSIWFAILLFIYALQYRTLIDGVRLVNKKVIKRSEIWKLLIPGQRIEYTKDLYFKK